MPCIQTFLVRQRVIGEPPNLIHNLALKRAEIGQLIRAIGSYLGGRSDQCCGAFAPHPQDIPRPGLLVTTRISALTWAISGFDI